MDSFPMVAQCASLQPLNFDGASLKLESCETCGDDILYNWYRNNFCAACDMHRELRGEVEIKWEQPESTQVIDPTPLSES